MKSMAKWILGAAVVAGGMGLAATPAKAAQFGVYIGQSDYVPPCPGPGYEWTAGYYSGSYWVPGRWVYAGYGGGVSYYDRDDWRRHEWREHERREWREHEWREHEWREHRDRDYRHFDRDRDRWHR